MHNESKQMKRQKQRTNKQTNSQYEINSARFQNQIKRNLLRLKFALNDSNLGSKVQNLQSGAYRLYLFHYYLEEEEEVKKTHSNQYANKIQNVFIRIRLAFRVKRSISKLTFKCVSHIHRCHLLTK